MLFLNMQTNHHPSPITSKNFKSFAHESVANRLPSILEQLTKTQFIAEEFSGDQNNSQKPIISKQFFDNLKDLLIKDGLIPKLYVSR